METKRGKIYFASDFHLGVPDTESSKKRELSIVRWLESIRKDAEEIYLLGDVFDFWFEYRHVVPKGYIRLQGKIAEITDSGIPVHWFTGNHDMWIFDYIPVELGVQIHREPIEKTFSGKQFFIGHGDGLGPHDRGYKFIKKVFLNPFCQWLFARLHPNFGIGMAKYWSGKSRLSNREGQERFLGDNKEYLAIYCKEKLKEKPYDFFLFGHRHLPIDIQISASCRYINLGDWVHHRTYAVFDGKHMELKSFETTDQAIFSTKSARRLE